MANKPLTIDVNPNAIPNGTLNQWTPLENTQVFINNIQTPKLSKKTNIGQLVSGIPSAFARVDLFKTALAYVANNSTDDKDNHESLLHYYYDLVLEWRGLVACMALDYAHISVRRIDLKYSDGKDISKTANVYEPKGAFGNMLLRRKSLWCDQPVNDDSVPFINVIKYRDQVVGATAPESLLFTSTGYKIDPSEDRPWISTTGKFIDPIKAPMTSDQISTLYAYVNHLIASLDKISGYYAELPEGISVNYGFITMELEKWRDEIKAKADDEDIDLKSGSIPPVSADFSEPFQTVFCHQDTLYGIEGVISEDSKDGAVVFDPKNLLLDESAKIARLSLNIRPEDFKKLPILVMRAEIEGSKECAYFALPLSAQGLNVYGKNVAALVGMSTANAAIESTLQAHYTPSAKEGNLEVVLTIKTTGGTRRQFKKVYTTTSKVENQDILIWPNFVSPQWDAYYMYSELPHNARTQSYRAFPFVGEMQGNYFRILVDENRNPLLLSEEGRITVDKNKVDADLLVLSGDAVADNKYKYEIYRSNRPFKGVRLLSPTGNEGGYLLINYSSDPNQDILPQDRMLDNISLDPVDIGIDFGSTNTSVAYSNTGGERGFVFKNQRVSLLGNELPGYPIFPKANQVLFFPGAGCNVQSNSVKSVLTLHDQRRLREVRQGETSNLRASQEVLGGFPCFADNLPFSGSSDTSITLNFPVIGDVMQVHNMKWNDNEEDQARKEAFLRTLMLQIFASLFADKKVPDKLKWSFPSAMKGQILNSYGRIWSNLSKVAPVKNEEGKSYKLNVSRYISTSQLGEEMDAFSTSSDIQPVFGGGNFGSSDGGFGTSGGGFGSGGFGGGFGSSDGGFGGGFGTSDGGFGGGGFGSDVFGTPSTPDTSSKTEPEPEADFLPDSTEGEIRYEPKSFYTPGTNPSLSEAEAVANFLSVRYGKEANVLNLCFDVGGSTTDISALFFLNNAVTMIKQNSLRFAAQRVSQVVGRFPNFKRVLIEICHKFNIQMVGLNFGPDTYSEATAPYFFDQIVNRLNDNQLPELYQLIAATCPKLMVVNLYVTGLLMFYAGEIAHKLIDDLLRTPESEWPAKTRPNVRVTFAGKGSRLFQWLDSVAPKAANDYYGNMFVLGYGRDHLMKTLAGWQRIELRAYDDDDIKYEVSKGLAKGDTTLQRPKVKQPSEIIGETGFMLVGNDRQRRPVDFTNSITPEMMKSIGVRFLAGPDAAKAPKFTEFCGFFYTAAQQLCGWGVDPALLAAGCRDINLTAYAQNMPEYRQAEIEARSNRANFSFVAPIIILEGMKFYEDTLLTLLQKS